VGATYGLIDIIDKNQAEMSPSLQAVRGFILEWQRVGTFMIAVPMAAGFGCLVSGLVAFSNLSRDAQRTLR
jgi:hypothetical protein